MTELHNSPEFFSEISPDQITDTLGYEETEQMKEIRQSLVDHYSVERLTEYQILAEEFVDKIPEDSNKKRLGYIISLAMIRRDVGQTEGYLLDLQDAINYAYGMGFDDIAESLEQLLSQAKETR